MFRKSFRKSTPFYILYVWAVFCYLRWRFRFWGHVAAYAPFRDEKHRHLEIGVAHWVRNGLSQEAAIYKSTRGWRMTWDERELHPSLWAALDVWCVQVRKQIPPRRLCELSPEECVTVLARANNVKLGDKKRLRRRHRRRR